VNSLPKTVTQQRRGCDLNPGPTVPESSTPTTRLPSNGHGRTVKVKTEAVPAGLAGRSLDTESARSELVECASVDEGLATALRHRTSAMWACGPLARAARVSPVRLAVRQLAGRL